MLPTWWKEGAGLLYHWVYIQSCTRWFVWFVIVFWQHLHTVSQIVVLEPPLSGSSGSLWRTQVSGLNLRHVESQTSGLGLRHLRLTGYSYAHWTLLITVWILRILYSVASVVSKIKLKVGRPPMMHSTPSWEGCAGALCARSAAPSVALFKSCTFLGPLSVIPIHWVAPQAMPVYSQAW